MKARLKRCWFVGDRNGKWTAICLLLGSLAPMAAFAAGADTLPRKNVLILTEVGLSHPAAILVPQEIVSALQADTRYETEFYSESLDSMAFPDEPSQQQIRDWLEPKYRNRHLDVIIAMGPGPIKFLSRAPGFLSDIPVVFCGSTPEQAGNPRLDERFTGTWLRLEPAKTVEAALRLLPRTRQIFVVGGSSAYDREVEALTRAALQPYEGRLNITYLTSLTLNDLLARVQHLPRDSVVLYTSFWQDAAGRPFVNTVTVLPAVSRAANVPVFGMSDTYLGHGAVGGYVLSFAEQGRIAAHIVQQILQGSSPQQIPVLTAPGSYVFDWRELQRWGLSEEQLPDGSSVLYREPTLWERAKWVLIAAVFLTLALSSLTIYLLYKQKELARARRVQMRLSGMLINAQEDERKRLASELHDDFSQRLALLSMGIETAAELVPKAPERANQQLHDLLNSASELGSDLHTLSHRLHSSTLERLGLVAGVGSFCKEFAAQQGVQVSFTHNGVPHSVPPKVSLCLFRVVQEALRNVKKHSGASKAQVVLDLVDGCLHLSVSDDGTGFDPHDPACNHGLGIFSMEERARLIGARFEIRSAPRRGTQIDVWTQFQSSQARKRVPQAADNSHLAAMRAES